MNVVRLAVLFLVAFLFGCSKSAPTEGSGRTPTPTPDPKPVAIDPSKPVPHIADNWTHKELAAYLNQKGVKVEVDPAPFVDHPDRPAALIRSPAGNSKGSFFVYRCVSAEAARIKAEADTAGSFSFGRFAFGYNAITDEEKDFSSSVRKALESR